MKVTIADIHPGDVLIGDSNVRLVLAKETVQEAGCQVYRVVWAVAGETSTSSSVYSCIYSKIYWLSFEKFTKWEESE
jgi:Tfp pilus assembly protein PilX